MKQRAPKEKKKRSLPARIILSVLLFAALAVIITAGAFAGTAYTMVNKISREEPAAEPAAPAVHVEQLITGMAVMPLHDEGGVPCPDIGVDAVVDMDKLAL